MIGAEGVGQSFRSSEKPSYSNPSRWHVCCKAFSTVSGKASEVNKIRLLASAIPQRTPFVTEEARQSKLNVVITITGRFHPSPGVLQIENTRLLYKTRKRHGSLTMIIGCGQRFERVEGATMTEGAWAV